MESGGGDKDGVERSVGWETECAVAGNYLDIGVAERGENGTRVGGQGGVTFNRENLCGKFAEEGSNVSGTGTDFEDSVGRGELEGFQHDGDDVGLRNGLAVADGQRVVVVGFGAEGLGNEFVAGNAEDGVEDARVGEAAGAELGVDHELAGGGRVGHRDWLRLRASIAWPEPAVMIERLSGERRLIRRQLLVFPFSLESPEPMKKIISQLGSCVFYQATAWDHYHDVYGIRR